MKKENIHTIIIVALLALFAFIGAKGENFKAPVKNKAKVEYTDTTTSHTYEIQDIKYPVFKSKSGAYYIYKVSRKSGKEYKYYLPKEIQIAMGRTYNK